MKKILSIIGLLVLTLSSAPTSAADEGWKITNFVSASTIQADGKVQVQETIDVDFSTLVKHGIYRYIPYRYQAEDGSKISTDIENVSVTDGSKSVPYTTTSNDANFEMKIGDANKTVTGTQRYVISYLVTGVLRNFNGFDELYWNVTGNDWPVPIEQASATVTLPNNISTIQTSCYEGTSGSKELCAFSNGTFSTTRTLNSGEGFTIAASYPMNSIPLLIGSGNIPGSNSDFNPLQMLAGVFITMALGIGFLFRQWWKNGRDSDDTPNHRKTIIAEYEPPANLRPGEIGVLMDERADAIDLSASIVDLAVRGYLTITEVPKTWVLGSRDYKLDRTNKTDSDLMAWEKKLLSSLFETGSSVQVSKLKSTSIATSLKSVKDQLYEEVTKKDLFTKNPENIRNQYLAAGVIIATISFMLPAVFFVFLPSFVSGILFGLIIVGILTIIAAFLMPKRTSKGRELFRQAQGYKLFLITTDKDRIPFFEKEGMFMKALPYAMVFGVTSQLAKVMKDLGIEPTQPSWYIGTHPFVPVVFASDMSNFSNSLNSAFAPVSSSSGSSGGGFSGGGFGGGGGGSW